VAGEAIDAIKGNCSIIGEVNEVVPRSRPRSSNRARHPENTRSHQHAAQGTKNVADNITVLKAGADAARGLADD